MIPAPDRVQSPRRPAATRRLSLLALLGAALAVAGTVPARAQEPTPPQQARLSVRVDTIVVEGNVRTTRTEVVDRSGLRPGMVVQYPQVQDAIRRLFATGEYENVEIYVTDEREGAGSFHIAVEERPFIEEYVFRGLESVSPSAVRDSVGMARNAPLDPSRVTRARALVERLLADEGFPRARVDTAIVESTARPGDYLVVFDVAEGPRLGIVDVAFVGNEAFGEDALEGAMSTGEEGFLWLNAGELKREEYRLDLNERLPEFYARHGYLDFAVVDDTILVDQETGKGIIRITVDEGPQYLLDEFRIQGNRRFPTAQLEELFRAGQRGTGEDAVRPFDQTAFTDATADLGDLYRDAGYLRSTVIPDVQKLPPDSAGGQPRVVAAWLIREGNPTYVREVRIAGNTYTHDRIIRNRLFVFPGDIYSQQRLIQSVQQIQGLGFFEPLPPNEAIDFRERPDGDVDLTFRVREKNTGTLNFGVSASAATGLAGFIGYEQPNLFGQAKSGRFRWLFGGRQQDIEVSYSDPEIFGSDQSLTATLRSSRDRFLNFSLGDQRQTGGSLEVGTPVFGLRSTRLFIGYSLFVTETRGIDTTGVSPEQQILLDGTRSTASLRLVRDTRNSPLFPTDGSRNSLSTRYTGGFLGGDGQFGKFEFESEWFVPVARLGGGLQSLPIEVTAGLSFRGGMIVGENPFFFERFFMGGTNVGVQLRGYEESTVTPRGHIPRNTRGLSSLDRVGESYFATTALVGSKLTSSIFVSAFMDAGNVWDDADDLNPTDLLVGAGLGVSLVTPFGPLGIDYAYGFDRRDVLGRPDPGWELHFKFGRIF